MKMLQICKVYKKMKNLQLMRIGYVVFIRVGKKNCKGLQKSHKIIATHMINVVEEKAL